MAAYGRSPNNVRMATSRSEPQERAVYQAICQNRFGPNVRVRKSGYSGGLAVDTLLRTPRSCPGSHLAGGHPYYPGERDRSTRGAGCGTTRWPFDYLKAFGPAG